MSIVEPLTASIVSHGQMPLVNHLIADLIRHAGPQLRRVVVTLNVPESEPLRVQGAPFEVIVLRNESPLGFGSNHNRAFQHCQTPWFAVLNPDLRVSGDVLASLTAAGKVDDGLIAPLIVDRDGSAADAARRLPTPWKVIARRLARQTSGPEADFDWLAGMCLVFKSDAFRELGGFDEAYFMYCEDADLCLRLQLKGWGLRRITSITVVHDARRDSHRSLQYLRWHLASLLRLWTSAAFWAYVFKRRRLRSLRRVNPH